MRKNKARWDFTNYLPKNYFLGGKMKIIVSNTLLCVTAESHEMAIASPVPPGHLQEWNGDCFTHCTHKGKRHRTAEESGTVSSCQTLTHSNLSRTNKHRAHGVGTTLKRPRREREPGDWWKDRSWFRTPNWVTTIIYNVKYPYAVCCTFSLTGHWGPHTISLFISLNIPVMYTVASGCSRETIEGASEEYSLWA